MAGPAVGRADPARRPKIAIGFFGLARSLKWTLPSIKENIIEPARELGDVRLFAHLYQQNHITNPRSGENDPLDPDEYRLLECDEVRLEEPGKCLEGARYEWVLSHGDAFHDGGKSLANLIHQLHSLQVVGEIIDAWKPNVVILARPDLHYHDNLSHLIRKHLKRSSLSLSLPDWQWYGGYNDRFAVCGSLASKCYSNRLALVPRYLKKTGGPLPAERFLRFCLNENGVCVYSAAVQASRVRANGQMVNEDFRSISKRKIFRRKIEFYFYFLKNFFIKLLRKNFSN